MNVVLGICTYRRPEGLRKLLEALPQLDGEHNLHVVVADNDEAGEGIAVCDEMGDSYPITITRFSAVTSGISAVRNAVAQKALSLQPDMIAFLDDDEWPEPQWLRELLRIQAIDDTDVVGGPTRPVFPDHAPDSLRNNPYYGADLQLPDNTVCQLQAGGNFLIKTSVLARYAPDVFDEAFSHTGSEDLAFFTKMAQDGRTMRWAANAIVHEPVPESRLAPGWLKQRVVNIHNSRVRAMQLLQPGLTASSVRVVKTCALAAYTALLSVVAILMPGYRNAAQLLRWKLKGKLTAHLGKTITRGETY